MSNFCKLYSTFLYVELGIVSELSGIRTLFFKNITYILYTERIWIQKSGKVLYMKNGNPGLWNPEYGSWNPESH